MLARAASSDYCNLDVGARVWWVWGVPKALHRDCSLDLHSEYRRWRRVGSATCRRLLLRD